MEHFIVFLRKILSKSEYFEQIEDARRRATNNAFSRFTWLVLALKYYYRYKLGISWWKTGKVFNLF